MAKKNSADIKSSSYRYEVFSQIDGDSCSSNILFGVITRSVAVAEADRVDGGWIINRVFVRPKYRRRKFGTIVLEEVLFLLKNRKHKEVYVSPGGYDFPIEIQEEFYRSLGFKKQRKNARSFAYGSYIKLL